ncbi:MAG TPA: ABC transporter substrate-binding protein [Stellaceae bacterium]|jgi:NitT/TauT family transport system substrate-binding protein
MKRWLAFLAVACLGLSAPARAEDEHALVALPAEVMQFLGIYAAEDEGFWKEQGLDVKTVMITGIGSFNAVVAGSADFSVSSAASLTRAASHGQRMLAIANMIDRPVWTIVISKAAADAAHYDPEAPLATRAKILAGKKISVDGINSVIHGYLRVIAKAGGVDPDSIIVTPMAPSETLAAFSRHAIDGFVNGPPWPEQVLQEGTGVAVASPMTGDPDWIAPNGSGVIIARPQFCAEHRSICMKMGRGLAEGAKFIHDKPDEALALLKKHFDKTDPAVVARVFKSVSIGTPVPPRMTAAVLANSERLNIEAGLMTPADQLKSYDGLFTDEFIK